MLQWSWGCIYLLLSVFITFRYFLEVELLDYMVVGLNFLRIFHKISIVTAPINNPTNQCTHPFSLHPHQHSLFSNYGHSKRCVVLYHCSFSLHFPKCLNDIQHVFMNSDIDIDFFVEMSYSDFWPFIWLFGFFFFLLSNKSTLYF